MSSNFKAWSPLVVEGGAQEVAIAAKKRKKEQERMMESATNIFLMMAETTDPFLRICTKCSLQRLPYFLPCYRRMPLYYLFESIPPTLLLLYLLLVKAKKRRNPCLKHVIRAK